MLDEEYALSFFDDEGFSRRRCAACGMPFWSLDERELCGDPPCVEYGFIGDPVVPGDLDLDEMRERFLVFFEERDHKRLEPYPVVARWRDDIYLTIASIADFQPHVTSGRVPPPANPLVISQPCIRLNDLDSVGRSGRHLSTFEMMGHHAFNSPDEEVYWKEECVDYCHDFLTRRLRVEPEGITYKENPWVGGGNAGPALEVLVGGLELATLVFMMFELAPGGGGNGAGGDGAVELKGDTYVPMDQRVVDTGYGLERFVWASQGTPTIYDAIYPDVLAELRAHTPGAGEQGAAGVLGADVAAEYARIASILDLAEAGSLAAFRAEAADRLAERGHDVTPEGLGEALAGQEALYAVADHARCLALMLGDGIVPSNAKAGYLARLVARRALRLLDEAGCELDLAGVVDLQLDALVGTFPDLKPMRETVLEECRLEEDRYARTLETGKRMVKREVKRLGDDGVTPEFLVEAYDSHGLSPEVVQEAAGEEGVAVEVPDDFWQRVAERHGGERRTAAAEGPSADVPPTRLLYYESPMTRDFEAVVLWSDDDWVVMDQTAFYPEGGGQPPDRGVLTTEDASVEVTDVQKRDGVVFHRVSEPVKTGGIVHGRLDWGRRMAHTRHHTATHIMLGAARHVLGNHVWQAGTAKFADRARLDVTHYNKVTDEELREIETVANMIVMDGLPIEKSFMDRNEAERKYGFILYQGGVPAGDDMRVVRIVDFDVQMCAGTHATTTADVGPIKILRTERIQDGVERLEYAAGIAAVREIQRQESILKEAADTLSVPPDKLPPTVERFFGEWKELQKQVEALKVELAEARAGDLLEQAEEVGGVAVAHDVLPLDAKGLDRVAKELASSRDKVVVVLGSAEDGALVVARSADVELVHAGEIVDQAAALLGGGGGGGAEAAQGGGPDKAEAGAAVERAVELVKAALDG